MALREVKIESLQRKGFFYTVTLGGKKPTCSCPQGQLGRECKHLPLALAQEAEAMARESKTEKPTRAGGVLWETPETLEPLPPPSGTPEPDTTHTPTGPTGGPDHHEDELDRERYDVDTETGEIWHGPHGEEAKVQDEPEKPATRGNIPANLGMADPLAEQKPAAPAARNIYEAIAQVYRAEPFVVKVGSENLSYSFASEEQFIAVLRPLLIQAQIIVYPLKYEDVKHETVPTRNGGLMNRTTLRASFVFCHAPTETAMQVEVIGEGMDSGDKSQNKAMTAAYKYALRQTFMVATGDDPDYDSSAGQERARDDQRQQARGRQRRNGPPQDAQRRRGASPPPQDSRPLPEWAETLHKEMEQAGGLKAADLVPILRQKLGPSYPVTQTNLYDSVQKWLDETEQSVRVLVSRAADQKNA